MVDQTTEAVLGQAYYSGKKESDKLIVRQLLADTGLNNQQLSLDALYLDPLTVSTIHKALGRYLIGLKANQTLLYRSCICRCLVDALTYESTSDLARGHGRLERRHYQCFTLSKAVFAPRWRTAGFQTLIRVKRTRQVLGGEKLTEDISYYLSNELVDEPTDGVNLCAAIRGHWRVETMHYRRNGVLLEDSVRTNKSEVSRLLSSLRTLTINLLHRLKLKNMVAQLDSFADDFSSLIQFMQAQAVL